MINGPGGMQYAVAERQAQQGGDWFFWIAGLSLVNSILMLVNAPFSFFFGLGTTDFITAYGTGAGAKGVALVLDVVFAGIFALFGVFARKGQRWAFLVGMLLYVLDGLVCLLFHQYLAAAVHGYALYRLFQGFQAAGHLVVLRAQQANASYGGYVPPASTPPTDVWPPPPSA